MTDKKIIGEDRSFPKKIPMSELPSVFKNSMDIQIRNWAEEAMQAEHPGDEERRIGLEEARERSANFQVTCEQVEVVPPDNSQIENIREWEDSFINQVKREEKEALTKTPSYKRALEAREEALWEALERKTVKEAIEGWLSSISNSKTKRAYAIAMHELCKRGLIKEFMSLQNFSLLNHDVTVDRIKQESFFTSDNRPWSEATRQQRAAAFVSFTGFLSRRTSGIVRKATPNKEGQARTFHRINQHVTTPAFQRRRDWERFLKELDVINRRDCLIAKVILQGGKRISEVLSLLISAINFQTGQITFEQSKTKGESRKTVISYRQEFMNELQGYIGDREGLVFVTAAGRPVRPQQIDRNFKKAGERAGVPFTVTPHVLRATTVTYLKQEGFSDSDIMKVTGHADSEMIRMYDKSALADNASKKINLI